MTFAVYFLLALFLTACFVVYKIITSSALPCEEGPAVADDFLTPTGGSARDHRIVMTDTGVEIGHLGLSTVIHSR